MGDISVPDISGDNNSWPISLWVVIFFGAFQFFILIVLLNFLIAQVSQSYDEVVGQEERIIYNMRADFNKEVMALIEAFSSDRSPGFKGPVLYVRYPQVEQSEEDVYAGFVKTVKNSIARSVRVNSEKFSEMKTDINAVKSTVNEVVSSVNEV